MEQSLLSQVNVRIGADLKVDGERALAKAGFTPTRAVRALWRLAVKNADTPERLAELLEGRPVSEDGEDCEARLAAARTGSTLFLDAIGSLGIQTAGEAPPYADLREQVLLERLGERGLL